MFSPVCNRIVTTNNYSHGRQGYIPTIIVAHTTQGSGSGAVQWFRNPASQVSAHYVVMEDGEVIGMVDEDHTAWHAGRVVGQPTSPYVAWPGPNPNLISIGIEFAGFAASPLGPQQVSSGAALIRDIRSRRGNLPIVGHGEISPGDRSDPGGYNLEWIRRETEGDMWDSEHDEAFKQSFRAFIMSPEGANLVEFAVSRPGGFGDKLAEALGRRMEEAVRDAMAEALAQ